MGRKGVSKRKPKKSGTSSNANISGSSTAHSPVQSLMNDKGAPSNRGGVNPSAGSNKKQKKH